MKTWGRRALAVVVGVVLWGLLWNVATAAVGLEPDRPLTGVGTLTGLLAWSAVLSVLAGWVAAIVAGSPAAPAVWALAVVNLTIGVVVEVAYWELMPAWYHVVFLALVVPATLLGGRLRERRAAAGPVPAEI